MAVGWPIPHWRQRGRMGGSQSWKEANSALRGILYQATSSHPVTNQNPVGFWMVDFCQEGRSKRSAPQRDIWHTGDGCTRCHSGNQAAGTGEVIRRTPHLGRQHSPSTWSPELLGPGKGTKCRPNGVCPFVDYLRT